MTRAVPPLSVVMPVRNGEPFLSVAIQSVLSQTYSDFEFIIVDDGSSDETPSILRGFASADSRIRLFKTSGEGIVAALNLAIEMARGDFVARMDSDDIALPERFAIQTEALQSRPDHVAIGSNAIVIDSSGRDTGAKLVPTESFPATAELLQRNTFLHPTIMMRRAAVVSVGLYRSACIYAEDYDLWLRLAEIGEMENMREPLLRFRMHAHQTSKTRRLKQRAATALARQMAIRRRSGRGEGIDMAMPLHDGLVAFLRQRAEDPAVMNRSEAKDIEVILREVYRLIDMKLRSRLIERLRASHSWSSLLVLRLKLAMTTNCGKQ